MEEEYIDDGIKVRLSCIDHEGARRCATMLVGSACSICRGTSTLCSERLDHQGALMLEFKGKCTPIEQGERQDEAASLSFAFSVLGNRSVPSWENAGVDLRKQEGCF